jgi:hypothetical protein
MRGNYTTRANVLASALAAIISTGALHQKRTGARNAMPMQFRVAPANPLC